MFAAILLVSEHYCKEPLFQYIFVPEHNTLALRNASTQHVFSATKFQQPFLGINRFSVFQKWHDICENFIMTQTKNLTGGITMELIRRFMVEEEGQGLVEYALIIGLIAVVAIAALTASGGSISSMFNTISSKLSTAQGSVAS